MPPRRQRGRLGGRTRRTADRASRPPAGRRAIRPMRRSTAAPHPDRRGPPSGGVLGEQPVLAFAARQLLGDDLLVGEVAPGDDGRGTHDAIAVEDGRVLRLEPAPRSVAIEESDPVLRTAGSSEPRSRGEDHLVVVGMTELENLTAAQLLCSISRRWLVSGLSSASHEFSGCASATCRSYGRIDRGARAHRPGATRGRRSMAAARRSGKASGVQANAGTPTAVSAAACSWS